MLLEACGFQVVIGHRGGIDIVSVAIARTVNAHT
jgi:hypothetical protein